MPGKSLDDRQEACRIDGLFEPNHIAKLRWCVRPMRKARGDDDGDAAPKQGPGEVGAGPVRELEVENGKLRRMVLKPSESLNTRPKRPGDRNAAILQGGFQSERDQRLILGHQTAGFEKGGHTSRCALNSCI